MSLFIGPIHHWLWNKIVFQNNLTEHIILSLGDNQDKISTKLNENYSELSNLPLEEQVDTDNIHGWLQENVGLVESRYAFTITEVVRLNLLSLSQLKEILLSFAEDHAFATDESSSFYYQALQNLLLDGMPCDRVHEIVTEEDLQVVWRQNSCVHEAFWIGVSGDISLYYQLREALISGLLVNSNLTYRVSDNLHYLESR